MDIKAIYSTEQFSRTLQNLNIFNSEKIFINRAKSESLKLIIKKYLFPKSFEEAGYKIH